MDFKTMNTDWYDLADPAYCVKTKRWYVLVAGQTQFYLHNDQTIQMGVGVEFVPGEMNWSGYYDSIKEAKKAMRRYNTKWELEEWGLDIDEELKKELQSLEC